MKIFAPANHTNYIEVFDMSITSDAVRIVKELVDEILGMVHLGRVQEMMDDRMTTGKSEVMEEHDWVKEIEAEEKEKFVKKVVKPVDVNAIVVECVGVGELHAVDRRQSNLCRCPSVRTEVHAHEVVLRD